MPTLLTLLALLLAQDAPAAPPPPSAKERKQIIEDFFAVTGRTAADAAQRRDLAARLDTVSLARASDLKQARKDLAKAAAGRREMEQESGRHFWWEEERRGLYIVGGETRRPKGLLLGFHGGGVGSGDAGSAADTLRSAAQELGLVGIFPEVLEKTEHGWTDSGTEEWVLDLMECALRTWSLDPAQVYFTGHSMGGYGTWVLGAHHADRVAGLAASAGAPTPVYGPGDRLIGVIDGVVPNLRNVPLAVYQSLDDPNVPPDANQAAVQAVAAARERWGGYERFSYWEVNGRGHDLPPGGMIALLQKVRDAQRDPVPAKLVWQPSLTWKTRFFWLHWPEPKLGAVVEAEVDRAQNRVLLRSEADLRGLEVLLDERLIDPAREVLIVVNDLETWRGRVAPALGTLLLTSAEGDPGLQFWARVPARSAR